MYEEMEIGEGVYIFSSTDNDPIMYLNGVSQTVTEVYTPVGTYGTEAGSAVYIGDNQFSNRAFDGQITGVRLYDLTSLGYTTDPIDKMAGDIGAGHLAFDGYTNGMVMNCPLLESPGFQMFDGSTLSTDNIILDFEGWINGEPQGSPIGRADTILTYGGK